MISDKETQNTSSNKFPLTKSQESIWAGQQISGDHPLYNMAHTFALYGPIIPATFQKAFDKLIQHFDVLRYVFGTHPNGEPYQEILDEYHYEISVVDFSEKENKDSLIKELIDEKTGRNLDLSKPPFESFLIKMNEVEFIWFLNIHHIITDVTSIQLIYDKMSEYYHQLNQGDEIEEETKSSFASYIYFEQSSLKKDPPEKSVQHWNKLVRNQHTKTKLYGQDIKKSGSESVRVKVDLDVEVLKELNRLVNQPPFRSLNPDLSYYMLCSTFLVAYIHKITNDKIITIGSPSLNRQLPEFRNVAGLFIELLPFQVEVDPYDSLLTLYPKVRAAIFDFLKYSNPGSPNSEVSRKIGVVINYIPNKFSSFGSIPVNMNWIHPNHIDPSHVLRLQVNNFNDEDISIFMDINTSVFADHQVKQAPVHFQSLVSNLLTDQNKETGAIDILTSNEKDTLLKKCSSIQSELPRQKNILDLFRQAVIEYPSEYAIYGDEWQINYKTLDEKSNQLANHLTSQKIGKGDQVLIRMKRSPEFIIGVLATLKSGACYIPVPIDYPIKRLEMILLDVSPKLILSDKKHLFANSVPGYSQIQINLNEWEFDAIPNEFNSIGIPNNDPAYIMYTSGSTGKPKGVVISHGSLYNYVHSAYDYYFHSNGKIHAPLFTSIGFDLTITSLYLPLVSGGSIQVFEDDDSGHDLSILKVVENKKVNFIKLTPSHAKLISDIHLSHSNISTIILGGENLDSKLTQKLFQSFGKNIKIYNEYGPTEATVGCIVKDIKPDGLNKQSVPIGKPFAGAKAIILDDFNNLTPIGVPGELYVSGPGLANGYWNNEELSQKSFTKIDSQKDETYYKTGDLVRINDDFDFEYLGRIDQQLKIGGIRMEKEELESVLKQYNGIKDAVIHHFTPKKDHYQAPEQYCTKCGMPSNYPNIEYDEDGVCNYCQSFETYQKNVSQYFKSLEELQQLLKSASATSPCKYDCMMLLSGGKDSSYALAKLVDMGLNVLAYTLDNGYISDDAKRNIKTVVVNLGVDHMYDTTPHMNEIFVDSLKRFSNVCNGCFKTLYTLSTKKALELGVPVIVTGLSRGQFFETRLTEELFRKRQFEVADIDQTILDARKAYHRIPDAVSKYLDVSMFESDDIFKKIQFVDFYRFCDVNLGEMFSYLDKRLNWVRPKDTGRSTNCLINDLGIYIHRRERGYHNYAFPYSWDVRMGHKDKKEAIEELDDSINPEEMKSLLAEIGYPVENEEDQPQKQLVAYYISDKPVKSEKLKNYIAQFIPQSALPAKFIHTAEFPLNSNGKIDFRMLSHESKAFQIENEKYIAPENEIEEAIAEIWQEVMQKDSISMVTPFLELGGNSLLAIRIISRINENLYLSLKVTSIFENDTIRKLSKVIEVKIEELMRANDQ